MPAKKLKWMRLNPGDYKTTDGVWSILKPSGGAGMPYDIHRNGEYIASRGKLADAKRHAQLVAGREARGLAGPSAERPTVRVEDTVIDNDRRWFVGCEAQASVKMEVGGPRVLLKIEALPGDVPVVLHLRKAEAERIAGELLACAALTEELL